MSATQSALIIGATGQTGRRLLQSLLASSHFTRVGEYGRRVTPLDKITAGKDKLEQKTINFEKIGESGLKDGKWDVVFITLGTTRAIAGSAANFEKIDREYVVSAAKEARDSSIASQRVVYLSSVGANSSSPFLYPKSKGMTEQAIADLGYSDTIVFRPGFLAGTQRESSHSALETAYGKFTGFMSRYTDSIQIDIGVLGKAIYLAGKLGSQGLPASAKATKEGSNEDPFTVVGNSGALKLAELKE